MKKSLLVSIVAILIGGFFVSSVVADDKRQHDTLVKFKGGIGAILSRTWPWTRPPALCIITRNMVRGVNSPGQIWRIDELEAKVKITGTSRVNGRGLILAGGNNIGRRRDRSCLPLYL